MSMPALIAVRDLGGGEAGRAVDLVDAVPVRDDEAGEAQLALEHGGDAGTGGRAASTPFQLLNEIITEPTPRWTAAWNGGRWMARSSASVSWVLPWSVPSVVPPSPT